MTDQSHPIVPRVFYLNEKHELAHADKEGGGRLPKLAPTDWKERGLLVHRSLTSARQVVARSADPLRESRFFLTTVPVTVKKISDTKKGGHRVIEQQPRFDASDALVFRRLGMDLLSVDETGRALVHAPAARLERLETTAANLATEGDREKARWASIGQFEPAPASLRIDRAWLEQLPPKKPIDTVVELQPLLSGAEADEVGRAVLAFAQELARQEVRFVRSGADFSGRQWFRGLLTREMLEAISLSFYSVQALHEPFVSLLQAAGRAHGRLPAPSLAPPVIPDSRGLPCVAVVDTGVPDEHLVLAPYRRGRYQSPDISSDFRLDHGSFVASRVVFGDLLEPPQVVPRGECAYLDVRVAKSSNEIDDKAVLPALQGVAGAYPDVRVFNLSLGNATPVSLLPPVARRTQLQLTQDLDNFLFATDSLAVVAAGNTTQGVVPNPAYPNHADVPEWGLGAWACGFNTLTCGAFVGSLGQGVAGGPDWPSPFTRVGPGLAKSMVPDFGANGGNCGDDYHHHPWLGVWGCDDTGDWLDRSGSSHAAPILAREAAFAFAALRRHCEPSVQPFAATVKAVLFAGARRPLGLPPPVDDLADRTIGRGRASSSPIHSPASQSALLVWQGILEGPEDIARVRIPVPREWLDEASQPVVRVVGAWNSPVNAAAEGVWACRRVTAQLRPQEGGAALWSSDRASCPTYPVLDRRFHLKKERPRGKGLSLDGDNLLLEVSYQETAPYPAAGFDFSPLQRVGMAIQLFDEGEEALSPQPAMQALPAAATMLRLSVLEQRLMMPVLIRRPL